MGARLELAIAGLNGLVGDYLARTGNGLATEMTLVADRAPLPVTRAALAAALPAPSSRVVVLIHGLMGTEDVWAGPGGDFGRWLARDLGMTPLYVRYNSGLPISDNGAALAALLEALVDAYPAPLDELVLLGHSMGGLVARGACHTATVARHRWLARVARAIYVGTPHRGSPLERWGKRLSRLLAAIPDPYVQLAARIGDLRSAGIQDLGDPRHPIPLLPSIRHLLIAGTLARDPTLATWFGDALVPVPSATDGLTTARSAHAARAALPAHVRVLFGVGHMRLCRYPEVYAHVRGWCTP